MNKTGDQNHTSSKCSDQEVGLIELGSACEKGKEDCEIDKNVKLSLAP